MEIQVTWETTENYSVEPTTKLKEFINNYTTSLNNQLVEEDYSIKFNNNTLSKILLNNHIKDLINKFHGNRIDVSATTGSSEEIRTLFKNSEEKLQKFEEVKKNLELCELENLQKINFDLLKNKLKSLILPLNENNTYALKAMEKIVKKFSLYDEMFKETEELKNNMIKLKITESLPIYKKILFYCLGKVIDFLYRFGVLFLNNRKYLNDLSDTYNCVFKEFFSQLNEEIRVNLKTKKYYAEHEKEYEDLFRELDTNILLYSKYGKESEANSTVFFSFDEPVQVNISEMEYKEIKTLLTQFPNYNDFKELHSDLTEDNLRKEYLYLAFEMDLKIYQFYGIKMEEFVYANLLYEN